MDTDTAVQDDSNDKANGVKAGGSSTAPAQAVFNGSLGYCQHFELNEYLNMSDDPDLDLTDEIGFELWYYNPTQTGTEALIMKHDDVTKRAYGSWSNTDTSPSRLQFQFSSDGTGNKIVNYHSTSWVASEVGL